MDNIISRSERPAGHAAPPILVAPGLDRPLVTVVIPNYNREALIGRAIRSCLSQTCPDFEVIVVDDGSSDSSLDVIRGFEDPRISVVVHPRNRGVCPARNTGADMAKADWILMLDSDDELLDTAVETVADKVAGVDSDVGCVYFRCRTDDGSISPAVGPVAGRLDYVSYLRYIQSCTGGSRDLLYCVRRSTFDVIRFPDNFGLEDQYHLDFSRMYVSLMCPEVIRLYHQDAANSLVKRTALFEPERDRKFVRDRAENIAAALRTHRGALRRYAPGLLAEYNSRLLTLWLLCGHRARAAAALARVAATRSELLRHTVIFSFGVVHPALLAMLRSSTRRLRKRSS